MTIETKIAKNGSLTVKVDFKRAKRNDAERVIRNTSLYGGKVEIIAEPNDPYGVCDIYTGGFDATENCYVFVDGAGNTYHFAYVDDILYDMAHGTLAKRIRKQTSATDVDAEEYAVSTEAQEIATNAEIELATANNTKETIEMTTMTDADKAIAERKTMTRRELFLEAKKEITYKLNARGAKIWYISYPQYDIRGKYIGHTPALKCTRKEVVAYLRDNYCGLTVDDFLAEQEAWIDEETTKAIIKMNIDDQAEHVSDKVAREVKPCDNNDNVFALLPELDELNDVSDIAPVIQPLRQTFVFTPVGNERHQILTSGDVVTFLNGKLHHITSTKYAAWFSVYFCHYAWHTFKDGKIDGVNGTNDEEEFFSEMAKRGACTIDEPKLVDDYDSKRQQRRADNDIPQDYLDAIVAQTMPRKRREPTTDAELIANGDELKAIEGRIMGRDFPRFGQPNFDAPLVEWYREYQFRRSNPFWYEDEYHYLDDGTRIHAKK